MAGYDGLLHGGIVATALDAAATQCLFAHGVDGLTALLNIRYRRPAPIDQTFQLQAWLESASGGRFRLRAELRTDQTRVADAEAVFVKRKSASGQASTSLAVSPS